MVKPERGSSEATYQDVLDAPEHRVAELIDGRLYLYPRPAGPHSFVTTKLLSGLDSRFGDDGTPGGWVFLLESELHFGNGVYVPDIAGWRESRVPDLTAAYFTDAPDWICETISASTEKVDRIRKLTKYAEAGVGHVWFLHPLRRTLEVMRRHDKSWLLVAVHADEDVVRAEPFDAVELELARLWRRIPPPGRVAEAPAEYAP